MQVQLLQREAELAEAISAADSNTKNWTQEHRRLQDASDKWRGKALDLQEEVRSGGMPDVLLDMHSSCRTYVGNAYCGQVI